VDVTVEGLRMFDVIDAERQTIIALLMTWPIHAIAALVFAIPTFLFTRKRISWKWIDYLSLLIPLAIWVTLFTFGPRYGNFAMAFMETVLLGCAVGLSFVIFAFLQRRLNPSRAHFALISLASSFAVLIWAIFPVHGE